MLPVLSGEDGINLRFSATVPHRSVFISLTHIKNGETTGMRAISTEHYNPLNTDRTIRPDGETTHLQSAE